MEALGSPLQEWRVKSFLGAGGYGEVYLIERVTSKFHGRRVEGIGLIEAAERRVIKLCSTDGDSEVTNLLQMGKDLSNKVNIMKYYGVAVTTAEERRQRTQNMKITPLKGVFSVVVMQCIRNKEVFDLLATSGKEKGFKVPLTPPALRRLSADIISALHTLYRHNISHNDLKPENLLLDEEYNVVLCDMGLASKTTAAERFNGGTQQYFDPIRGSIMHDAELPKDYDAERGEVFSLGIVLLTIALKCNLYRPTAHLRGAAYLRHCKAYLETFWTTLATQLTVEYSIPEAIPSTEFQAFISCLWDLELEGRPTFADLQKAVEKDGATLEKFPRLRWLAGPFPTDADFGSEIKDHLGDSRPRLYSRARQWWLEALVHTRDLHEDFDLFFETVQHHVKKALEKDGMEVSLTCPLDGGREEEGEGGEERMTSPSSRSVMGGLVKTIKIDLMQDKRTRAAFRVSITNLQSRKGRYYYRVTYDRLLGSALDEVDIVGMFQANIEEWRHVIPEVEREKLSQEEREGLKLDGKTLAAQLCASHHPDKYKMENWIPELSRSSKDMVPGTKGHIDLVHGVPVPNSSSVHIDAVIQCEAYHHHSNGHGILGDYRHLMLAISDNSAWRKHPLQKVATAGQYQFHLDEMEVHYTLRYTSLSNHVLIECLDLGLSKQLMSCINGPSDMVMVRGTDGKTITVRFNFPESNKLYDAILESVSSDLEKFKTAMRRGKLIVWEPMTRDDNLRGGGSSTSSSMRYAPLSGDCLDSVTITRPRFRLYTISHVVNHIWNIMCDCYRKHFESPLPDRKVKERRLRDVRVSLEEESFLLRRGFFTLLPAYQNHKAQSLRDETLRCQFIAYVVTGNVEYLSDRIEELQMECVELVQSDLSALKSESTSGTVSEEARRNIPSEYGDLIEGEIAQFLSANTLSLRQEELSTCKGHAWLKFACYSLPDATIAALSEPRNILKDQVIVPSFIQDMVNNLKAESSTLRDTHPEYFIKHSLNSAHQARNYKSADFRDGSK